MRAVTAALYRQPRPPLRLLHVEDREDDAVLVARELTRAGYDVSSVRVDTEDALRRELTHARWDVVIADYTIPGFSGSLALNMKIGNASL